ncbi:hypothetical protein CYLTODRAFT_479735 [Cylindrobasidium torrendii FP15055 ss-10]|uniref:Helicase C-terminal domain-containing protein n=1 Tax=Cylindrobasidium torrendii FP15055 ss-10 TaxID=1314674 RepID=A0A0D7AS66_9AGAR|nr:hypothetical protein CYLTODRAFT_479735 [Cylindrobasidium torrendii FP15055 ss-10]
MQTGRHYLSNNHNIKTEFKMGGKAKSQAPVRETSVKLSIIVFAIVLHPELFKPMDIEGEMFPSQIVETLGPRFPPLWDRNAPRVGKDGVEFPWAAKWDEETWHKVVKLIRERVVAYLKEKNTNRISGFKWRTALKTEEGRLMAEFADLALDEKWHIRFDTTFDRCLTENGVTVKKIYDADPTSKSLPGVDAWSQHYGKIAQWMFGYNENWNLRVPETIVYVLKALVTLRLDASRHWLSRQEKASRKRQVAVNSALGTDFLWKPTVPRKLTSRSLTTSLKKMREYRDLLEWTHLTPEEEELVTEEVDLEAEDAFEVMRKRYQGLPEAVMLYEQCFMSIGWMSSLIRRRSGKDTLEGIEIEGKYSIMVNRGKWLGNRVYESAINEMAEMDVGDAEVFRAQVTAYVLEVTQRETPPDIQRLQDMMEGREPEDIFRDILSESGDSVGIEAYRQWDVPTLCHHLGYQQGARPLGFRDWMCSENNRKCLEGDRDKCEHAVPVELFWHQLCCVARIIDNAFNGVRGNIRGLLDGIPASSAARKTAPTALKEGWSNVPGMLVALDVGMGKTVTLLAMIATYAAIVDAQKANKDIKLGVQGKSDLILPSAPHIICVPASLLAQWMLEILKYLKPGMFSVHMVRRSEKSWLEDLESFLNGPQPPHRKILLISHTSLARMWKISSGKQYDAHSVVNWTNKKTVYRFSWGSVSFDESHAARGDNQVTDAFDGLCALSLVKNAATGTPLIQGASDLRAITRIIRPPTYTEEEARLFNTKEADLKRLKRAYGLKLEQIKQNPGSMGDLTTELSGSVSVIQSKVMVIQARLHLLPYILRVTKKTLDNTGQPVTRGLPDNTSIILAVSLSEEELLAADSEFNAKANEAGEKTMKNTGLEGMSGTRFGVINMGLEMAGEDSCLVPKTQEEFLGLTANKLRTLVDVTQRMITLEPGNFIPPTRTIIDKAGHEVEETIHGSQNLILEMDEIGLLPGHDDEWKPPAVVSLDELRAAGKRVPKIVIYMSMAQYHPAVVEILGHWGINALSMSGAYAPSRRAQIQREWEDDENIPVLVISDAGSQGLNLVAADGMILLDTPWSETEVTQIIARSWRHGQKRETFVIRLVAKRSVEYMMIANGISKRDLLDAFMDGKHSPHLIRALTGTGTDEDTSAIFRDLDVKEKDVADLQYTVAVKKRGGRKKKGVKSAPIIEEVEDLTQEVIDVDNLPDTPPPKKSTAKKPRAKKAPKEKEVSDIQPPRRAPRHPSPLDSDSEEDALKLSRPASIKPVDDNMDIDNGNEATAPTTKEKPDAPSENPEGQTSSPLLPPHGNPTGSGVRPTPPAASPNSPAASPSPPVRPDSPADGAPSPRGMEGIEDSPPIASQWKAQQLAEQRRSDRDASASEDEEAEKEAQDEPMAPAPRDEEAEKEAQDEPMAPPPGDEEAETEAQDEPMAPALPAKESSRRESPEPIEPGSQPGQDEMEVDTPDQPVDTSIGPHGGRRPESPLTPADSDGESRPAIKRGLSSPESGKGKAKRAKVPRKARTRRHVSPEQEEEEQASEPDVNLEDPESPAPSKRLLGSFRTAPAEPKASGSKAGGSGAKAGSAKRRGRK